MPLLGAGLIAPQVEAFYEMIALATNRVKQHQNHQTMVSESVKYVILTQ